MKVKLICHHKLGIASVMPLPFSFIYSSQQTIIRMLDYAAKSNQGVLGDGNMLYGETHAILEVGICTKRA